MLPLCRCKVHCDPSQPRPDCRSCVWNPPPPVAPGEGFPPAWPCDSSPPRPDTVCRTWWWLSRPAPPGTAWGRGPRTELWRCSIAPVCEGGGVGRRQKILKYCMDFSLTFAQSLEIFLVQAAWIYNCSVNTFHEKITVWKCSHAHRRTGPVSVRGAEVSCTNSFFIACPENQGVFARILPDFFFLPGNGYLKNSRGAAAQPPGAPWAVCLCPRMGGGGWSRKRV